MKAKPMRWEAETGTMHYCEPAEATHVRLHLPGPLSNLHIPVLVGMSKTQEGTHCWSWNGDTEKPTLEPSVLNNFTKFTELGEKQYKEWMDKNEPLPEGTKFDSEPDVHHITVADGKVTYCDDCTDKNFAGQTLDLLDIEI